VFLAGAGFGGVGIVVGGGVGLGGLRWVVALWFSILLGFPLCPWIVIRRVVVLSLQLGWVCFVRVGGLR
jgi:hypothetical protein